jgi:hypothetical protein
MIHVKNSDVSLYRACFTTRWGVGRYKMFQNGPQVVVGTQLYDVWITLADPVT